ncbi:uncharacterized protein LOC111399443 isoform X2 [Olea europaea var. sylvestris]|uniref:uncharacterized protein LOC111399443 isoform X2 n=1 Tax=Olea europaea var. sylvestris TaxID=158386 RepID=UPI000C1D4D1E|nr:uncharacterized protein LOC111399443 isoform X2 [Olea europaea var. sylvestris]
MAHRKANKPKEIRHQVDWDYLCDYWESERFQKRSKVVVDNRSRQEFTHFSGSISFIQWQAMGTEFSYGRTHITRIQKAGSILWLRRNIKRW